MAHAADDFARVLGEVLTQFGRQVVDRPDMLRGALSDTLGAESGRYRPEIDATVAASREGVAAQIRDSDPAVPASPEQVQAWFDQLLEAGIGLRDAAIATGSWATVFDARGTAQVTSEVSQRILGADVAGAAPTADPPAPTTRRVAPGEAATDLADASVLAPRASQVSETHTVIPPRPPLPPDEPASTAVPPPPPPPPPPAARAAWLDPNVIRGYWPVAAAAAIIAVTLGVGVPVIATNAAPKTLPPFEAVEVSPPGDIFERSDLARFTLDIAMLDTLVDDQTTTNEEKGDDSAGPGYYGPDAWDFGFVAANEKCKPLFLSASKRIGASSDLYFSGSYDNGRWRYANSAARWYETPEEAALAFDALHPSGCSTPQTINVEARFGSTVRVSEPTWVDGAQVRTTRVTADSNPAWNLYRRCVLNLNVVACVSVSGTAKDAGTRRVTTQPKLDVYLEDVFTDIAPAGGAS